jgi:hypothetical protein
MSRREYIVLNKEVKLLTNQTTVIADITITTTLVRAAEHNLLTKKNSCYRRQNYCDSLVRAAEHDNIESACKQVIRAFRAVLVDIRYVAMRL